MEKKELIERSEAILKQIEPIKETIYKLQKEFTYIQGLIMQFNTISVNDDLNLVVKTVCEYYGINYDDMRKKSRQAELRIPRQLVCWLSKDIFGNKYTLNTLAKLVGNTNHCTVINGIDKINDLKTYDTKFRNDIEKLKWKIIDELHLVKHAE